MAALERGLAQLAAPLAQKEQELAELALEMAFLLARHIAGGESGDARTEPGGAGQTLAAGGRGANAARARASAAPQPGRHVRAAGQACGGERARWWPMQPSAAGGAMVEFIAPDGDPLDKIEWDASLECRLATMPRRPRLCRGERHRMITRDGIRRWRMNGCARASPADPVRRYGRIVRANGEVLHVSGIRAPIGARCLIEQEDGEAWRPRSSASRPARC